MSKACCDQFVTVLGAHTWSPGSIQVNQMNIYLLRQAERHPQIHRQVSPDPWSPQGQPHPGPGERVKIHQGQRGARTKPGDTEEFLGKLNTGPPVPGQEAPPGPAQPQPSLEPLGGSCQWSCPGPAGLCDLTSGLSFTKENPAPTGCPHQACFSPRVPLTSGPAAGTSRSRPGGRKAGPSASTANILARSCTQITHSHPHRYTFALKGS